MRFTGTAALLVMGIGLSIVWGQAPQPPARPTATDAAAAGPAQRAGKKTADRDPRKRPAARVRPEAARPTWIWLPAAQAAAERVCFRKELQIKGEIAAARFYAACDNEMTLYVDGKQVLHHVGWEKPVFQDLTDRLGPGRHVLAVEVKNHGGPGGLVCQLALESGWRDAWAEVSDPTWLASSAPPAGWQTLDFSARGWSPAHVVAPLGGGPWTTVTQATLAAAAPLREPAATPVDLLKLAEGFEAELLYSVPKATQGSWVNMCVDPQGRLIVSDQYGGLYRVTPPAVGEPGQTQVERIPVDLGEAQGLLWAFDSLYVVVNPGKTYRGGVYRVRDTDGDGELDHVKHLRALDGRGEHGPHAILLTPDQKALYVVCGNGTNLTEFAASRVPRVWDEDLLLPRTYGRGFMKGKRAPGGYISRIDPDGQHWELIATGFRNEFDAALNADGELFTFDADMEWDMNTPWYRPTRVCHVVSGAEFGWRNGAGKWPAYYPDSVPAAVDIGPGSPTGICFGYGAKFPAKYQRALFVADWSYGKLYAVHLAPQGASYTGTAEEFVTGTPLPLTDVVINPHDGAMYFAIGGRRVQSGLYRVTYRGGESTAAAPMTDSQGAAERKRRRGLEALHQPVGETAVTEAWQSLDSPDRALRYAARIALEHQDPALWRTKALQEPQLKKRLAALLALVRQVPRADRGKEPEIDSPLPAVPADDAHRHAWHGEVLAALRDVDWQTLDEGTLLELLRVYTLAFLRLGPPSQATRGELITQLNQVFPASTFPLNSELAQLAVYLQAPDSADKIVTLLEAAPTQEQQIDFAKTLRHLRASWTPPLRERYLKWFVKAGAYRGGASFGLFVQHIKDDAVAQLSDAHRAQWKELIEAQPESVGPVVNQQRPFVKKWTLEELVPLVENGLKQRDFSRGKQLFGAANCFACHRFDNQGGAVGPDLTALSGRFNPRDLLESLVLPSKVISDQYEAVTILTLDGKVITGRIVNLAGDSLRINTNMLDPNAQVGVDRKQIDTMQPSRVSMMPEGLLNTLDEAEVLDLVAYLLSRGDPEHAMFSP